MQTASLANVRSFLSRPRGEHVALLWLALFGAYALLNFTTLPFSIPALRAQAAGYGILNTLPHYDAATAYAHIASYTPAAVRTYHTILVLDVLLLIPLYAA